MRRRRAAKAGVEGRIIPRLPSVRAIGIGVLLLAVGGCANTQGYPDPTRTPDQIASVRCRHEYVEGLLHSFAVSIVKINGSVEFEKWKASSFDVDLLPGTYQLDVIADWESGSPRLMQDRSRDRHPRRFELTVSAGHTYFIGFDTESEYYLLMDVPSPDAEETEPPERGSIERCDLTIFDEDRGACERQVVRLAEERAAALAEERLSEGRHAGKRPREKQSAERQPQSPETEPVAPQPEDWRKLK